MKRVTTWRSHVGRGGVTSRLGCRVRSLATTPPLRARSLGHDGLDGEQLPQDCVDRLTVGIA